MKELAKKIPCECLTNGLPDNQCTDCVGTGYHWDPVEVNDKAIEYIIEGLVDDVKEKNNLISELETKLSEKIKRVNDLETNLVKYGKHLNNGYVFCETYKSQEFGCTCGLDAIINS